MTHPLMTSFSWRAWQSFATTLLVCLALLLLIFFIINKRPAAPIYTANDALNVQESKALAQVLDDIGDVQFYRADLNAIKEAVLDLAWVDSVLVYRDWQHGVVVDVRPKVAVANFGSNHLLDVNGQVYSPADPADLDNAQLVNLHGDSQYAPEMMRAMHRLNAWYTPVGLITKEVLLTDRGTWIIRFDNGLRVLVNHERTDEKLYLLAQVLADKHNKLDVDAIQTIDLRYKNGFSIAWKNGEKQNAETLAN